MIAMPRGWHTVFSVDSGGISGKGIRLGGSRRKDGKPWSGPSRVTGSVGSGQFIHSAPVRPDDLNLFATDASKLHRHAE